MDDRALVAALVAGDQRGLEGAYRAYADRLFTYCRGMLHDPDSAADAVHDTFVIASQRAHQLREPDRLRPWLYAIARNECLRLLRGRARQVPLAEVGDMSAPEEDPVAGLSAAEVQELVWAAAEGLNRGDREVFELTVRHELPAAEVGALLGVSTAHAHARLSRARAQLERGLGALLVARTGTEDCPALAELLAAWDGRLTALIRKRVSRHIDACDICAERQRRQLHPAALFSAYAAAPWLVVPAELWPRLERTSFASELDDFRAEIAARAGRFNAESGFPSALAAPQRRVAVAGVAAAAAAVALLAVVGGVNALAGGDAPQAPAAAPPVPTAPALAPPAPTATGTASATPTVPVASIPGAVLPTTLLPAPTGPGQTAPPATSPPPRPTGPQETVSVTAVARCAGRALHMAVQAEQPLTQAVVWIDDGAEVPFARELSVSGATAEGSVRPVSTPLSWWVTVTAADGRTGATDPVELTTPCS